MVEFLRVLKVCRKTAVKARRVALQIIQTTIVCAPDRLRDLLRNMTRMQLIRTLAAWRPDLTGCRDVEVAYRIALKSLARRYLELHGNSNQNFMPGIGDVDRHQNRRVLCNCNHGHSRSPLQCGLCKTTVET